MLTLYRGIDYFVDYSDYEVNTSSGMRKLVLGVYAYPEPMRSMSSVLYGGADAEGKLIVGFDKYEKISGRHEGIDFRAGNEKSVYALTSGKVTVSYAKDEKGNEIPGGLTTIAIYDEVNDKTVIYLHTIPIVKTGSFVNVGDEIATESSRGTGSVHTHVEVRDGNRTLAYKSIGDPVLNNSDPTKYWESQGYVIK